MIKTSKHAQAITAFACWSFEPLSTARMISVNIVLTVLVTGITTTL